jgi:hypothetical protein
MSSDEDSVTVQILRSIRDEIVKLRGDTNERIDRTNERLDLLAEGQIRLATEMHELRLEVEKNGRRFDHFLETAGSSVRDLQDRVRRLEDTVYERS